MLYHLGLVALLAVGVIGWVGYFWSIPKPPEWLKKRTTFLRVADFSKSPAGRMRSDGPHSGECFREERLLPALQKNAVVIVILDGTMGYGSSWLDEAFGGLLRTYPAEELVGRLEVHSFSDPSLAMEAWGYILGMPKAEKRVTYAPTSLGQ